LGDIPLDRLFNEEQLQRFIFMDSPVLFYYKDQENVRTCSAPHMISMMTSLLEIVPTDKVLILGSKGGLVEAVVAKAATNVNIVEAHEEVASITEEAFIRLGLTNIWVHCQNPFLGLPVEAPYSKILVMGAVPFVPANLLDQLCVGGIMVVPIMLDHPDHQAILQILKENDGFSIMNYGGVIFQPLYTEILPPRNERDLNFEKIRNYAEEHKIGMDYTHSFQDQFIDMPKVNMENLIFKSDKGLRNTIETYESIIPITLEGMFFNQEEKNSYFKVQWTLAETEHTDGTEILEIPAKESLSVDVSVNIPSKEGEYNLIFVGIDRNKYRIFHSLAKLQVVINKYPTSWDVIIDFHGELE
jgi:protein-L-isoaspartate(D-aspartate) O-methyltransferase